MRGSVIKPCLFLPSPSRNTLSVFTQVDLTRSAPYIYVLLGSESCTSGYFIIEHV